MDTYTIDAFVTHFARQLKQTAPRQKLISQGFFPSPARGVIRINFAEPENIARIREAQETFIAAKEMTGVVPHYIAPEHGAPYPDTGLDGIASKINFIRLFKGLLEATCDGAEIGVEVVADARDSSGMTSDLYAVPANESEWADYLADLALKHAQLSAQEILGFLLTGNAPFLWLQEKGAHGPVAIGSQTYEWRELAQSLLHH